MVGCFGSFIGVHPIISMETEISEKIIFRIIGSEPNFPNVAKASCSQVFHKFVIFSGPSTTHPVPGLVV